MNNTTIPVLLIEDDQVDIESLRRAFKKNNISHPLYIAHNGIEALETLRGINGKKKLTMPLIVLLDIKMPKMDGIEFLEMIRSDESLKSLLVFVLTSSQEEKDIVAAYQYNVAGYILKPVMFDTLVENIRIISSYWSLIELPHGKEGI